MCHLPARNGRREKRDATEAQAAFSRNAVREAFLLYIKKMGPGGGVEEREARKPARRPPLAPGEPASEARREGRERCYFNTVCEEGTGAATGPGSAGETGKRRRWRQRGEGGREGGTKRVAPGSRAPSGTYLTGFRATSSSSAAGAPSPVGGGAAGLQLPAGGRAWAGAEPAVRGRQRGLDGGRVGAGCEGQGGGSACAGTEGAAAAPRGSATGARGVERRAAGKGRGGSLGALQTIQPGPSCPEPALAKMAAEKERK